MTNKYIIITIYFLNKRDKSDQKALIIVIHKIYLVNNLQTHLLIDNNIIISKLIRINLVNFKTYIKSCDINIIINSKLKE